MHRALVHILVAAHLLSLFACQTNTMHSDSPGTADSVATALSEGMAPTPYTGEQIRWSHPVGTSTVYRLSERGKPDMLRRMSWVESDEAGCLLADALGPSLDRLEPTGTPARFAWDDLRGHASFPEAATTITREDHQTPAGVFDCWKYVVVMEAESTATFWFDTATAGAPIDFISEVEGQEVSRMLLVESDRRRL